MAGTNTLMTLALVPSALTTSTIHTSIITTANPCNTSRDSSWYAGWAAGYPEAAKPPEDAIAGRAGIFCAGASGAGVRGPWRVSLASGERSGQEGEESLLRGKLKWKSASAQGAALSGTKPSERSFSGVKRA